MEPVELGINLVHSNNYRSMKLGTF